MLAVFGHHRKTNRYPLLLFYLIIEVTYIFPCLCGAQEPAEAFTLKQTIERALEANLQIKSSTEEARAALANQKAQRTNFFPVLNLTYQYRRNKEAQLSSQTIAGAKDEYTFVSTVSQPIFTGFSLLNQYRIARLGHDAARFKEQGTRLNVIFGANDVYFSLLKAQKLRGIAEQTVKQIRAQKEVAKDFHEVGMTPLNDLLEAQVELANANQELITAQNDLETARSNYNIFLRRPLNATVRIKDILDYTPFGDDLDYCLHTAQKNRPEIRVADIEVAIAEKELQIAQKDFYPTINLEGTYNQIGTQWDAKGLSNSWNIAAVATWDIWEWGKTYYGSEEKLRRLYQARYQKEDILDRISLEVKQTYLKTRETEKNIVTVEKAIEQAKENFRINQERYKEQVATSTDVLDAQTLLSRTMTNYYSALYDYKISKASLYRAMGREVIE